MSMLVEDINRVVSDFRDAPWDAAAASGLSRGVAEALRWSQGPARAQQVRLDAVPFQVTRGLLGPQPAAVFAAAAHLSPGEVLNKAALYAYHASIPWGVVASMDGATVFNSHWVRNNEWYRLPMIPWENLNESLDILNAVTPQGLAQGQLERVATRSFKPDRILLPVDDALVERLDHWRTETLRYSRSTQEIDESLQTLFAQLFVLRTVEDKGLAPELPSLSSICTDRRELDVERLRGLLLMAQHHIGSELFEADVIDHIPADVLCGIISDLYVPFNLPYEAHQYNFAWIDADILGTAYEKYLSNVLAPIPPAPQMALFGQPMRDVERISVRRSGGVYYTPAYLVQYLAERSLDHLAPDAFARGELPTIADFACGSGSFLVAAADSLIRRLREHNPDRNWAREIVNGKHIIGIDIDDRAVTMARLSLWIRFAQEPDPLPLPRLGEIIVHGDSLGEEVWATVPESYDVVLGNPPFVATGRTQTREDLAARFRTAQGRYDYSYLFVELAVIRLRSGGVLGMVVPNRLYRNRDAGTIRDLLTSEADLLTVVDFGGHEVFVGTKAYIGTILAQKMEPNQQNRAETVRVVQVLDVSPKFLGAHLLSADVPGSEIRDVVMFAYDANHPRGSSPWLLLSPAEKRVRARLQESGETLASIAGVFQGIRTGANDVFILQIESGFEGAVARVVNGLGESGVVETTLLHPVVFGSEIQRYDAVSPRRFLLYPYRSGAVIPESEIRETYPSTYEYLARYRDLLAARSSIESSGLRWYELVRKRDETWLSSPKLLIRDLATETSFAVDQVGNTFLVGGTAVVPSDSRLLMPLLAYLNSAPVNEYLGQTTSMYRDGFQKFEPQHLAVIPVLGRLLTDDDFAETLGREAEQVMRALHAGSEADQQAAEERINEMIRAAMAQK